MTTPKIDRKPGHEVERHPDGALARHTCFEPAANASWEDEA